MENSSPPSLDDLLTTIGNNDPRLKIFADFIKKQQRPAITNNVQTSSESKRSLRLEKENMLLQERIDILAAALGACSFCWGTDSTCQNCRGEGSVGSRYPVRDAYVRYVLPVVVRYGTLDEESGGHARAKTM
jgi:DnaJ-class molecular chaperone